MALCALSRLLTFNGRDAKPHSRRARRPPDTFMYLFIIADDYVKNRRRLSRTTHGATPSSGRATPSSGRATPSTVGVTPSAGGLLLPLSASLLPLSASLLPLSASLLPLSASLLPLSALLPPLSAVNRHSFKHFPSRTRREPRDARQV